MTVVSLIILHFINVRKRVPGEPIGPGEPVNITLTGKNTSNGTYEIGIKIKKY